MSTLFVGYNVQFTRIGSWKRPKSRFACHFPVPFYFCEQIGCFLLLWNKCPHFFLKYVRKLGLQVCAFSHVCVVLWLKPWCKTECLTVFHTKKKCFMDLHHRKFYFKTYIHSYHNICIYIYYIFNNATPPYQDALIKSGYNHKLKFNPQTKEPNRNNIKRHIIWLYPHFSTSVSTHIGRKF